MDDKKRFDIDPEVVAEAIQCLDCHACLEDPEFNLCKIDFVDDESTVMIIFGEQCRDCGYGPGFGDGTICLCPVRKEIHKKYGM
ncbi:MAG: hypothetical protein KZQ77_16250 [Candidatus Thiodiazotropha sp. (ex Notomyrtea botanica)]|nr:hypothetical protein [Candidatus Thiodiazotropha sp. (ex Notomyrtea botanica)]